MASVSLAKLVNLTIQTASVLTQRKERKGWELQPTLEEEEEEGAQVMVALLPHLGGWSMLPTQLLGPLPSKFYLKGRMSLTVFIF